MDSATVGELKMILNNHNKFVGGMDYRSLFKEVLLRDFGENLSKVPDSAVLGEAGKILYDKA